MERNLLTSHVLDTNVFTQSQRYYYPNDICPGFWECLAAHSESGRIVSIDRVLAEIRVGRDFVTEWANARPVNFFASTQVSETVVEYAAMVQWVQGNPQFLPAAKAEFASVADGWLVAYAKAYDLIVVTQEVYAATVRKRVPLPNVCQAFSVPYIDTFELLRTLNARFDWTP